MQFKTLKELILYTEKINRFENGEIVSVGDKKYKYNKDLDDWDFVPESDLSISLYEINQQLVSALPIHTKEQLIQDVNRLNQWYQDEEKQNLNYMMLNNDLRYYTLFAYDLICGDYQNFGTAVIDVIKNLGDVVSVDTSNPEVTEIWIRKDNGNYVVYLFGYDDGIVTFR